MKKILLLTTYYLLLATCLFSAEIEDVVFEPETASNIITIYAEETTSDTVVSYRIWYSSGNYNSQNNWAQVTVTNQTTVKHYIGNRLGDFRYTVQHSFNGGVTWWPVWSSTGTNPSPAPVVLSPYIHDFQRGSYGEDDESQLGMGPGWFFKYQLFDDSYVTFRIYPSSTVAASLTDFGFAEATTKLPIKTIIHKTPRSEEMIDSSWWNTDEWDCRNDSGTIVDNGVYIGVIDAYDKHYIPFDPSDNDTLTDPVPLPGRRGQRWFSIPVDVLRIMKLYANPINDYIGSQTFTYRLTGAAKVTIRVYQGGVTFTGIDTDTDSDTYGEPIPVGGYTALKTLDFYRPAGNWKETWNGYTDAGALLPDGLYTYTISAVNDYKRIATDELGNDHPIFGNITIVRTDPPSDDEDDTTTGTGNIVVGTYSPPRNRTVSAGVSSVLVSVVDDDVVVDTSKSAIVVTDPLGREIKTTPKFAGRTFAMNFPPLTITGEYKVNLNLVSKNGKYWNEKYKFTVEKSADFTDNVNAYPNPAKSNSVEINYPYTSGDKVSVKIFNLSGELIKEIDDYPSIWILSNVGNGLYFYQVEVGSDKSKVKTIMVAR